MNESIAAPPTPHHFGRHHHYHQYQQKHVWILWSFDRTKKHERHRIKYTLNVLIQFKIIKWRNIQKFFEIKTERTTTKKPDSFLKKNFMKKSNNNTNTQHTCDLFVCHYNWLLLFNIYSFSFLYPSASLWLSL